MTKTKFIRQLSKALRRLKPEERSRYLAYYEEAISDLMENITYENVSVTYTISYDSAFMLAWLYMK